MLVTWRYRDRNSIIQSFDPRAWVIFYMCFLATTLFFWDLRFLAVLGVMAVIILILSRVAWDEIRRPFLFMTGFIVIFSLLTFLTGRGGMEFYTEEHWVAQYRAPFSILGWQPTLDITWERIFYALSMLVRVFSLASLTILIPYTLNPALYGITFRGLGLPDKGAYAMDLTMRFIPSLARDFGQTLDAQRARGYEVEKLRGGLITQVRRLAPLIVPVTIHAIAGSEDIIDAMDLRAFGVGPRTWLQELHYRRRDRVLIAFGILLIAVATVISLMGFGSFWVPPHLIGG